MKNFKRVSALLMALVLVFGLLPALVLAEPSQSGSNVPEVGDNIIFAAKGAEADAVWAGAKGQLAAGEKFGIGWYGTCLHIIYAKQGVDTFKVNGKDAIVVEGDTYDIAVISYEDLGMEVTSGNGCYPLTLEVNEKTWEGFVCLDDLTAGANNTSTSATGGWANVYSYDHAAGTQLKEDYEMSRTRNEFDLAANPTIVYNMNLSITSLPTQAPAGLGKPSGVNGGYCGQGFTVVLGDPYTQANSANLPAAATTMRWSPIVFAKDADGKLYIAIWENNTAKYAYVDGITLDGTTAHDLDVRAEFSHASATSNVTVLKVYVNGVLFLTSNNARYDTALGTSNLANTYTIKRCAYAVSEALKLTFEAKQYVMTASADFELPEDPELELPNPDDDDDILPPTGMQMGDKVIFAEKGAAGDDVWAAAKGQLAAGEKFGIGWYGTCLHIIYAKQGVDAFKVNGKDATVVKGDTYDIAVISYEDLEMEVTSGNGSYPLTLEVNGKTWDGFVVLNDLGEDSMTKSSNEVTLGADEYFDAEMWMNGTGGAIEIVANEPVVMDWDINVKELPTSCDPSEITSWRGGWKSGYGYTWVKGISFVLYDPFTADANAGVQKQWIPISLIKVASGDLYVVYCDNAGQFKNVKLEGVTLDAENGTDLHFRVELSYADAANHTVALKCYLNDTFLFESADARSSINVGSTPLANRFGMVLKGNNYDVASNDQKHEAWANNVVSEAVEGGATVLENMEAIDFAMTNYTLKALNAEFELPEDPELPDPNGEVVLPPTVAQVGDKVVFAEKGAAGDDVWAAAKGQLAAGEKFGVAWYGTCFHIIYAKQGVDTFKVNGKDATVIKGDAYDVAVISYEDLGINVTAANVAYALKLEVNGKTWEGLVALNDLGDDNMTNGSYEVTLGADEYSDKEPWMKGTAGAIEIVANEPVVMDWDINVKELPTSCDPDEITSWRGGWKSGYGYTWVKGISFVLYDPFTADGSNPDIQKRWIPISLIKVANGDLYVVYCEGNQFKNVKLEGVTLDATNGTDLHFRAELSYADAANHTVVVKCYVNDTFLFESANARNTAINVGSTPSADAFGMVLKWNNYDVASNDQKHEAWANNKVSEAVEGGATVLENMEAIDFAMTNYTLKALNAEFELPEDPAGGGPAPTGDTNEVALYAALLVTSILGMVALAIPTIRKKLF